MLTYGVIIAFLIRYRRRPGRRAVYVPGNTLMQNAWVLGLGLVVFLLDLGIDLHGGKVWDKVKLHVPPSEVQVRVRAKQFIWLV